MARLRLAASQAYMGVLVNGSGAATFSAGKGVQVEARVQVREASAVHGRFEERGKGIKFEESTWELGVFCRVVLVALVWASGL